MRNKPPVYIFQNTDSITIVTKLQKILLCDTEIFKEILWHGFY